MKVNELNVLNSQQAEDAFMLCCGSKSWARQMQASRPFKNAEEVKSRADAFWKEASRADVLEAFTHHPKIGDVDSLRKKFASTRAWAENEQSGASQASEETLHKLADLNEVYLKRFGYIFIVCATGKSAEEMLEILESRISNEPAKELGIAAGEQQKITHLRIDKLLS